MKKKYLATIAAFVFGVMLVLCIITYILTGSSIKSMQSAAIRQEVGYINAAVSERQAEMLNRAKDWSWWEDAYNFMLGRYPNFAVNNLDDVMYRTNKLNFVVYLNRNGQILYKRGYDYVNGKELAFPPELLRLIAPGSIQAFGSGDGTLNGIVKTNTESMIVAVSPVKRTTAVSESPGWVIFATYISKQYLAEIDAMKDIRIENADLSFLQLLQGGNTEISVKTGNRELIVPDVKNGAVTGYLLLRDIYGNLVMGAKIIFDNRTGDYAGKLQNYIMAALALVTILLPLLVVLYMNKVLNWYIGE